MHTVKDLMDWLNQENLIIDTDMQSSLAAGITGVTDNSKVSDKNMAFFCKGAHFKIEYLQQAIQSGVSCYITDRVELVQFNHYILVSDIRRTMAIVANNFYDKAWKKLKLIGITGTKGKSTTAYMVKSIIDDYLKPTDKKCGILSSIENYDGQITEESHLTTLEPLDLHKMFYNMVQNGCSYCVMEVSSQALKYDRVYGITFDMGCFLNIGEDHISPVEHSSFEDYFNSKLRIIDQSKKTILFDRIQMPGHKNNSVVFFGKNPDSYYTVSNIVFGEEANSFDMEHVGGLQIQMRGDFNILNASAASAITHELKIPYNNIQKGLLRAAASGRMELFYGEKHLAIVDYAHNKLSYEALFNSINKEYKGFKVITIFGCPGGKAYKRRAELPQIAEKYSDYIYITEEDHGEEDLLKICQEIFNNLTNPLKAEIQMDREVAISDAFNKFEEKTLVLVLGKGRETRQKRGTDYIDTKSDVEMVKTYIRKEEKMESKLDQEILALKQDIIQGVLQNIAIKSVKGLSGTDAPFGIGPKEALLDAMEQSNKLGLKTVNLDNKIGYSEIGEGEEMVAILGHLDVVPFGDGWTKNPYGEILDDKIYGRGAADNKGPTIASLYALKAIQDLQIPLDKRIRVIYGSDEESGFQCVKHYIESGEELPVMGFTPDADYPVIFAEKGMIGLSLSKKIEATEDFRLLELEGGVAKNVVMPFVKMKYQSSSHILEGSSQVEDNVYEINFNGKSAHASTPELGSNAFMQLCKAVSTLSMNNDFMDIIHFVNDQFNFETNGKTLGVHYKDEESGEITLNIGLVSLKDQELTFTVDIRYPVTMDAQPFLATMENITKKYGIKMATTTHEKPLYIPKDSLLIQTLMKVYQEKTGDYTEAKSIGGGTYAKAFQNMVAFGVEFPGDTLPIHQPDEYIEIDKLIKSTQISAEAIVQLAKTGPSL